MPRRAAGRRNTMSIWRSALKKRRGRRPISLNSAELPLVTRSGQAQGAITVSIQRERVTWRVPLNRMSLQPRRCVNTFIGGLDDDSSIRPTKGKPEERLYDPTQHLCAPTGRRKDKPESAKRIHNAFYSQHPPIDRWRQLTRAAFLSTQPAVVCIVHNDSRQPAEDTQWVTKSGDPAGIGAPRRKDGLEQTRARKKKSDW
jgi:hypothetical protein